ncbi:MAG TPA: ferritin family protein [Desulfuromonadales bacterium]|nr:ferritin family protein [Desulfuromonadales bacterium]
MTGTEDFSGFEVIRAAMEVEKNGHRFYSEMAEKAGHPIVRELFAWLAQDEVGHLATLQKLVPRYQEGAFWDDEEVFLPYLRRFADRQIFPSAEKLAEALATDAPDLAAMDLAIDAEEQFAEYFHQAAKQARTDEGSEAFSWLAKEEERHAALLKERKQTLLAAGGK